MSKNTFVRNIYPSDHVGCNMFCQTHVGNQTKYCISPWFDVSAKGHDFNPFHSLAHDPDRFVPQLT